MQHYKLLLKVFLMERVKTQRKRLRITQEAMAEHLRIAPRSYISLERGDNGFSATTLMFFLLILPEQEVIQLCADFRTMVEGEDEHVVA